MLYWRHENNATRRLTAGKELIMTLVEAIDVRRSVRAYSTDPVSPAQREELGKLVRQLNRREGLDLRLIWDDPAPFRSAVKTYGMLTGVRNYILLAGPAGRPRLAERCGYCGEQLVLTAAAMGLGTCWVGGTYDKKRCRAVLPPDRELVCVIALGHPRESSPRDQLVRAVAARKSKSAQELAEGLDRAPDWFARGVAAVKRAPSAMNRQPVRFTWREDGTVQARTTEDTAFSPVDLGIAKLHFELGAHGGAWEGDLFRKAREEKSCGAVIWRGTAEDHQYLLAQHGASHWSFPKGHVEGAETEEETARREIREETGLEVDIDTQFRQVVTYYPAPGVVKDVIFFIASPTGGREHAQEEEIRQLGWFSFRDARPLVTFATDEEVLLAAETYIKEQA